MRRGLLLFIALSTAVPAAAEPVKARVEVGGVPYTVRIDGDEAQVFNVISTGRWGDARRAVEQASRCRVIDTTIIYGMAGRADGLRALLDCSVLPTLDHRPQD